MRGCRHLALILLRFNCSLKKETLLPHYYLLDKFSRAYLFSIYLRSVLFYTNAYRRWGRTTSAL